MPASKLRIALHAGGDATQQTIVLSALAAVAWWLAMPFTAEPIVVLPVVASLCWPWLLVRVSIGAKRRRTVAIALFMCFLVPWAFLLGWVQEVSVAGWPGLTVYSAMYMPVFALLLRSLYGSRRLRRIPVALTAAVVWTVMEYLRAEVVLDAWPFYLAAHGVYPTFLIHWAAYAGVWLVSFLIVLLSVAMWQTLVQRQLTRGTVACVVLAMGLPLLTDLPTRTDMRHVPSLRLLCVQTNLEQSNKIGWPVERQAEDVPAFLQQTQAALETAEQTDLVLWPETMVPGLGFDSRTLTFLDSLGPGAAHLARWPRAIQAAAAGSNVPWLVGSPTWVDITLNDEGYLDTRERFNSAVLVRPDGSVDRYDKIFLTPFGETMPWIRSWPWLEHRLMAVGASGLQFDLLTGDAPVALTVHGADGPVRLVTPICFEDAVPSVVRHLVLDTNADIIVNLSNDGWFGKDDAGRRTHEIAAAFRAIELDRPLVRVANTGFTASIDRHGHVQQRLAARRSGTMQITPQASRGAPTLYARIGNLFPQLLVLLTLAGVGLRIVEKRTAHSTEGASCYID